jgi:hypothetical protein
MNESEIDLDNLPLAEALRFADEGSTTGGLLTHAALKTLAAGCRELNAAREEITILKSKYADHHAEAERLTSEIRSVTEQQKKWQAAPCSKPNSELKPCPFCGSPAEIRDDGDGWTMDGPQPFWVQCIHCPGMMKDFYTADWAAYQWNLRHNAGGMARELAAQDSESPTNQNEL